MTRRVRGVVTVLAVALGGGSLLGCTGLGSKAGSTPRLVIGPEAAGQSPPAELPPKEAAAACLASAREMEKFGKYDEAIALYERARGLDPAHQKVASWRLAVLYDCKGETTRADTEFDAAAKLSPKDADLFNDIGYSHYCRGNWAKAEEYLTRATTLDPNHKQARTNLGMAIGMQGRTADAMACFLKSVPEVQARCNLGFLLAVQGRTDEAKAEYRTALTLAPDLKLARAALAKLDAPATAKARETTGAARAAGPSDAPPERAVDQRPIVIDPDAPPATSK